MGEVPGDRRADTVDTFKTGDPSGEVTGIVTTFMATWDVIGRAVEIGANLIITHEPTFYNHRDETDWLADDKVYQAKRRRLDDSGIVVWRFHDYWHQCRPDGIVAGLAERMGWTDCMEDGPVFDLPETTVGQLAEAWKARLGIPTVRVVGDPEMPCRRVGLRVGCVPGAVQLELLRRDDVDVLLAGEINEWDVNEYARDAAAMGLPKALIVLGHADSEEAGMARLVDWLAPKTPGITITHVPAGNPFRFV